MASASQPLASGGQARPAICPLLATRYALVDGAEGPSAATLPHMIFRIVYFLFDLNIPVRALATNGLGGGQGKSSVVEPLSWLR